MKPLLKCIRRLAVLALAGVALSAYAQSYPNRPIRLIIPYAAGQGTDIAGRYLADEMSKALKQAVVVDNRPGAGGNIGTQLAAKAAPDGYTLMVGTNATHAANAFLYANPGFDPQADFEPIAMVGILPLVYVTAPASPAQNMSDLTAMARAKPGALNTAVSTTTCRMAHELFKLRSGVSLLPVDFKGSAQSITAVVGGHVEFMVDTITSLRAQVQSGQVRALGVTSLKASRLLPGVKPIAEQGFPNYELVGWTMVFAPKGLPEPVSKTLHAQLTRILESPEVQEKLLQMGIEPVSKTGPELGAFVQSEKVKWGQLIDAAGLKAN